VVVLVAGAGVTTVDRVTVVVVAGTGVTATSCSHAPKALTLTAKSASLPMAIRFFMYPVRVPPHLRSQIAKGWGIQIDTSAVAMTCDSFNRGSHSKAEQKSRKAGEPGTRPRPLPGLN
jgi:hypothetical protein